MDLKRTLARSVKSATRSLGWEVRRRTTCIGEMLPFLERLNGLGFQPTNILDVGAHRGDWAREARSIFPKANFLLIEPQAEFTAHLKQFCAESPGNRYELAAAGPTSGEMVLNVWQSHLAGSSLLPLVDSGAPREQRRVPIVTIDSLYPTDGPLPDFVKLDVQGFELEALKGATRLFGNTLCFVMEVALYATSENRPIVADVIEFMDARDYKLFDIPGFLRRPHDGVLGEVDLAFVLRRSSLDRNENWC